MKMGMYRVSTAIVCLALLSVVQSALADKYNMDGSPTTWKYGNFGGRGWWGQEGNYGVDDMDKLFKAHDTAYRAADEYWGPKYYAAPWYEKVAIYAYWTKAYKAADVKLAGGLYNLPSLTDYGNGTDSWHRVKSIPKSTSWRNTFRWAAYGGVFFFVPLP